LGNELLPSRAELAEELLIVGRRNQGGAVGRQTFDATRRPTIRSRVLQGRRILQWASVLQRPIAL
jgi:hypothetical protein